MMVRNVSNVARSVLFVFSNLNMTRVSSAFKGTSNDIFYKSSGRVVGFKSNSTQNVTSLQLLTYKPECVQQLEIEEIDGIIWKAPSKNNVTVLETVVPDIPLWNGSCFY